MKVLEIIPVQSATFSSLKKIKSDKEKWDKD